MAIIRTSIKCLTCDQAHTVRIGMGQDNYQEHTFACTSCEEEIKLAMHIDYENGGGRIEVLENCERLEEEAKDAKIVNVDANFLIPKDQRHIDFVMPRLSQYHEMIMQADREGRLKELSPGSAETRPYRRPDYGDEWKMLRKAWSLHSNEKNKLSSRQIDKASDIYYSSDRLDSLNDWLFRFSMFITQPSYEKNFKDISDQIKPLIKTSEFKVFGKYYEDEMSKKRILDYRDLMKSFFNGFSDYSQVYMHVVRGIDLPEGDNVSCINFENTRSFYGDAFEIQSSLVDFFCYLNNMINGRRFDEFETLTREKYLKLDKHARYGPIENNAGFIDLFQERENELRNASHHKSFHLAQSTGIISYRAGKGGQGDAKELDYSIYLERCTKIFLQIMTMYRIEALVTHEAKLRPPV